jgi:hypothetical protein
LPTGFTVELILLLVVLLVNLLLLDFDCVLMMLPRLHLRELCATETLDLILIGIQPGGLQVNGCSVIT